MLVRCISNNRNIIHENPFHDLKGVLRGKTMTFWTLIRQRCWGLILVMAGVCVITFIISHMIPGDPARLLAGDRASNEMVEHIREQLGLNQPLYVQFFRYVSDLLHGDLGTSIRTGRPVLEDLKAFFPATLELATMAIIVGAGLGIPLGVLGRRVATVFLITWCALSASRVIRRRFSGSG